MFSLKIFEFFFFLLLSKPVPELVGFSIIVQTVKGHLEDLVCLTEAVPGTVVPLVHFNGVPDGKNAHQYEETTGSNDTVAMNPSRAAVKGLNSNIYTKKPHKLPRYLQSPHA